MTLFERGPANGESVRGARNGMAKLTEDKVRAIRRKHVPGSVKGEPGNAWDLAAEFGISYRHVHQVISGVSWGWLDDDEPA